MKIVEVRVHGFKSFVEPVQLRIEPGLTGIVGPNGCGKSNVLESLRWVMGATSAKALRGGEMDDVIFAGTDRRPPRDIAEVTITLDNAAGTAPAPFTEAPMLEVSRRIRRGIGSTFRVNGREVRARDVQLLFADASTGANSPSLVRQNQVSELISAKPENRRRILEEAAGIAGLHARRHEAELRLRAAAANVERLDDVLVHMDEQLAALKRQARQAARWRSASDEIRALEAWLFARRIEEAQSHAAAARAEVAEAERGLTEAAGAVAHAARGLEEAEAGLPKLREEQAVADALLRRLENHRADLERELAAAAQALESAEADIRRIAADTGRETQLTEDARGALARLAEEAGRLPAEDAMAAEIAAARAAADEADARRQSAEAALAAAQARKAEAEAERRARSRALEEAKAEAARRGEAAARAVAAFERLSAEAPSTDAIVRAQALADSARASAASAAEAADSAERESEDAGQQEALARDAARLAQVAFDRLAAEIAALESVTRRAQTGRWPRALDEIRVEQGHEKALAAALGEDLDAALDPAAPAAWTGGAPFGVIDWPAGIVPLSTLVRAPPALAARLAAVGMAETLDTDWPLPRGVRLVTRSGAMRRWDGLVRRPEAGAHAAASLLEQRNKLDALKARQPELESEAKSTAKAAAEARARADSTRAGARAARTAAPRAFAALSEAQEAVRRLDAERQRFETRLEQARAELDRARSEAATAHARLEAAEAALAQAPASSADAGQAEAGAAAAARQSAADLKAALSGLTAQANARAARRRQNAADTADWTRRLKEAEARLHSLERAAFDAETRREGARAAPAASRDRQTALAAELPKLEARKAAADAAMAAAESDLRAARETQRTAEAALAALREARAAAIGRAEAAEARLTDLVEEARRTLQTDPADLDRRARAHLGEDADSLDRSRAEARLARAQRDREALGGVNLAAEEEAKAQDERITSLRAERDDLLAALAKLQAGVDEINSEGRERLAAAFDKVHGHFRVLFETLFDGGSAELRLTESDDPLGGGLEVFACPPGKRLQSMSLMSGGEQALTATALIFAVFLSNPSPICVLDEVDAPLDDSNVDRYCRLLERMREDTETRFIVITHHPVTMSRMDRLFGVTMAERGVSQVVAVDLRKAEALIAAA